MTTMIDMTDARIKRGDRTILSDVSVQASRGEFIGVVGPNGAGKTTLLRTIAGLMPPASGTVRLDGDIVHSLSPQTRASKLSYLPQGRELNWDMDVEAIVGLGRFQTNPGGRLTGLDREAIDRSLTVTGIAELRHCPAATLSGGEAARMHLARALAAEAPVILADEPTAALDPRHQIEIMGLLARTAVDGALIIAALHDLSLARQFCTRIIVLSEGCVRSDGSPADVLTPELLANVFAIKSEWRDGAVAVMPVGGAPAAGRRRQ